MIPIKKANKEMQELRLYANVYMLLLKEEIKNNNIIYVNLFITKRPEI